MLEVSEAQVLYFRACRSHIAGPGAKDVLTAARDIIGAQAQAVGPALLALAQRTRGRPTAVVVKAMLAGRRKLVRTWGQRETIHIYDPRDWPTIVTAHHAWANPQRRGPMPSDATLKKALAAIVAEGSTTRGDLLKMPSRKYVDELLAWKPKYLTTIDEAKKFAAGRIVYRLSRDGHLCHGDKVGSTQSYATRQRWFPKLAWPERKPHDANVELTRRYFAMNGAASAKDVAHYFGARQRDAKAWVEALADELVPVACGDRKGLFIASADAKVLAKAVPKTWPLRLMPMWDTYLMGHADKSWTVPDDADKKVVWRSSAVVAAAVLDRGRVVAEWQHETSKDTLKIRVIPLSRWRKSMLPALKREAKTIAAHLGSSRVSVAVD